MPGSEASHRLGINHFELPRGSSLLPPIVLPHRNAIACTVQVFYTPGGLMYHQTILPWLDANLECQECGVDAVAEAGVGAWRACVKGQATEANTGEREREQLSPSPSLPPPRLSAHCTCDVTAHVRDADSWFGGKHQQLMAPICLDDQNSDAPRHLSNSSMPRDVLTIQPGQVFLVRAFLDATCTENNKPSFQHYISPV